jgi:hypothetical protein
MIYRASRLQGITLAREMYDVLTFLERTSEKKQAQTGRYADSRTVNYGHGKARVRTGQSR